MRSLVTGASGFVGRRLAAILAEDGDEVHVITRRTSPLPAALGLSGVVDHRISGPLEVRDVVSEIEPHRIFHLAAHQALAPSSADIDALVESNILLGAHILDASARETVVVYAESYFQYRDGKPHPHSLYSATKQSFSEVAAFYRDARGHDARAVVLYDNYGPGDTRRKLVPLLVAAARSGDPVLLGPLDQPVDLLHVDDTARGLIAAAAPSPTPERVTVRADRPLTVGEIVTAVEAATGIVLRVSVDPARTASDLPLVAGEWPAPNGWHPRRELIEGLSELWSAAD